MPHHGNSFSLINPCVSEHIAYIVEENRLLQETLRYLFGAQRISRHQDYLCDIGSFFQGNAC